MQAAPGVWFCQARPADCAWGHKMIKWFIRIVLALVLLPVMAVGIYTGWNWVQLRPDAAFVSYLKDNATPIDLRSSSPFAITEQDLNKRLILLGEIHGIAVGQDLDFALLRMLNARTGVRYYVGEFDPAQAAELNAYLDTGDEARLQRVFSLWVAESAQWGNAEFMQKIRRIATLNASLPPAKRIRFIGMDRVQDMPLMAAHLDRLLKSIPSGSWPGQSGLMETLKADVARTQNAADAMLPLAAVEASKTLSPMAPAGVDAATWKSLREAVLNLSDRATLKGRESAITASFERLARDPDMGAEKFYGFWGQFHVLDATIQGGKPFVRRLQEGDTPFKGNIVSLNIVNLDSNMMLPARQMGFAEKYISLPYSLDNPLLVFVSGINDAKEAATGPLTLFRMNAANSPYPGTNKLGAVGGLLGMLQPFVLDAASVGPNGASQYMILSKGSPATTPLPETASKSQVKESGPQ